ncbi:GPN-loop GTPase 2 (ATP-binding domain 1 family member B), partial [Durusdinium trenchii]
MAWARARAHAERPRGQRQPGQELGRAGLREQRLGDGGARQEKAERRLLQRDLVEEKQQLQEEGGRPLGSGAARLAEVRRTYLKGRSLGSSRLVQDFDEELETLQSKLKALGARRDEKQQAIEEERHEEASCTARIIQALSGTCIRNFDDLMQTVAGIHITKAHGARLSLFALDDKCKAWWTSFPQFESHEAHDGDLGFVLHTDREVHSTTTLALPLRVATKVRAVLRLERDARQGDSQSASAFSSQTVEELRSLAQVLTLHLPSMEAVELERAKVSSEKEEKESLRQRIADEEASVKVQKEQVLHAVEQIESLQSENDRIARELEFQTGETKAVSQQNGDVSRALQESLALLEAGGALLDANAASFAQQTNQLEEVVEQAVSKILKFQKVKLFFHDRNQNKTWFQDAADGSWVDVDRKAAAHLAAATTRVVFARNGRDPCEQTHGCGHIFVPMELDLTQDETSYTTCVLAVGPKQDGTSVSRNQLEMVEFFCDRFLRPGLFQRRQLHALHEDRNLLQLRREEQDESLQVLGVQHRDLELAHAELNKQHQELQAKYAASQKECDELREEMHKQYQEAHAQHEKLDQHNRQLEQKLGEAEKLSNNLGDQNLELEKQCHVQEDRIADLEQQVMATKTSPASNRSISGRSISTLGSPSRASFSKVSLLSPRRRRSSQFSPKSQQSVIPSSPERRRSSAVTTRKHSGRSEFTSDDVFDSSDDENEEEEDYNIFGALDRRQLEALLRTHARQAQTPTLEPSAAQQVPPPSPQAQDHKELGQGASCASSATREAATAHETMQQMHQAVQVDDLPKEEDTEVESVSFCENQVEEVSDERLLLAVSRPLIMKSLEASWTTFVVAIEQELVPAATSDTSKTTASVSCSLLGAEGVMLCIPHDSTSLDVYCGEQNQRISDKQGIEGFVFHSGEPIAVTDCSTDARTNHALLQGFGKQAEADLSVICVPIHDPECGAVCGVISILGQFLNLGELDRQATLTQRLANQVLGPLVRVIECLKGLQQGLRQEREGRRKDQSAADTLRVAWDSLASSMRSPAFAASALDEMRAPHEGMHASLKTLCSRFEKRAASLARKRDEALHMVAEAEGAIKGAETEMLGLQRKVASAESEIADLTSSREASVEEACALRSEVAEKDLLVQQLEQVQRELQNDAFLQQARLRELEQAEEELAKLHQQQQQHKEAAPGCTVGIQTEEPLFGAASIKISVGSPRARRPRQAKAGDPSIHSVGQLPAPAMAAEGAAQSTGFGQVVVGPPGSGKTTYCRGMQEFMRGVDRTVSVINLDPANEGFTYDCAVDLAELVRLEDVMEELDLGPNGGIVYCLEFLECNVQWLVDKVRHLMQEDPFPYLLFDLPGQVEISANHPSLRNIIAVLTKQLDLRLTAVHLVDAYHCSDSAKYISAVFLSLSTMLRLELPHVNVLSKVDLVESQGTLHFNLDFYTDVMDLDYLLPLLPSTPMYGGQSEAFETDAKEVQEPSSRPTATNDDDEKAHGDAKDRSRPTGADQAAPATKFEENFQRLNRAICDLIEQYSLVAFHPLDIQDKESVINLVRHIDKTNGYADVAAASQEDFFAQADPLDMAALQEKYVR